MPISTVTYNTSMISQLYCNTVCYLSIWLCHAVHCG